MKLIFILCLCLWIVFLTELSKADNTNDGMDKENSLLLELHKNYCGEDFLCKNDSSYWEPPEQMIPVPCCVPCSCLPTCGDQMDCCPALWKNEAVEDPQHGDGTPPIERSSNQSDVTDDVISRKEDAQVESIKNRDLTNLSSKTDCIRPQVLYKPNKYLDSETYEMVTTCPDWFKDVTIIKKCLWGMYNENILDMIPITSALTGLTYANKFCLDCNGMHANATSKFHEWQPALVGVGQSLRHRSFISPEFIIKDMYSFNSGFENIHFIPGKAATHVRCKTYDIAYCNQTSLLDTYNETMENSCQNGPSLPIIQNIGPERFLFKNIACLHCNMDKDFTGKLNSCGYYERLKYTSSLEIPRKYRLGFNLRSLEFHEEKESSFSVPYIGDSSLRLLKQGRCSPGYAELWGGCREVICPRHHYLWKNQCVPLYDTLSGLDINLKIQITPDREISNVIATEFEEILNNTVNYILKKSVSLQVRDIFLLFLPNKQRNRKKYYVFNIYLYSSTGEIKFSHAIMEMKTVFTGMKSHVLPPLSNGITVGLKIEIAHKIREGFHAFLDLSNGGSLILPMEDAWVRRIQRPNLEISDINWCYRTSFFVKEVKRLGDMVFEINHSVTVYGTEIDFNSDKVYICIDLCVTKLENVKTTRNPYGNLDRNIDYVSEELSDRATVLTVCLVVAVVLGIIFCKVRIVAKRKLNTGLSTQQSTVSVHTVNDISEQIEGNTKHVMSHEQNPGERKNELESFPRMNDKTNDSNTKMDNSFSL